MLTKAKKRNVEVTLRERSIEGNPKTRHARTLCDVGMSINLISKETGLTPGQIQYRLKMAGKRVSDYRNGINPLGKYVKRRVYEMNQTEIRATIKERLQLAR